MSLKFRRWLYITFIILFLIISPLVSLYAAGYRFDLSKRIVQKTGSLAVKTDPEGAEIFLNGRAGQNLFTKISRFFTRQDSSITTPAKLKNIAPGQYLVKVEKDGYWAWEKKLDIGSGQTTFAENINLYKKGLPLNIINDEINGLYFSPDQKYILAVAPDKYYLYDTENGIADSRKYTASSTVGASWSPDGSRFLVSGRIFGLADALSSATATPVLDAGRSFGYLNGFHWSDNNNFIYYTRPANNPDNRRKKLADLYQYDLSRKLSVRIATGKDLIDLSVREGFILILEKSGSRNYLTIYEEKSSKYMRSIEFSVSDNSIFDYREASLVTIVDRDKKNIFIINPFSDSNPIKYRIDNAISMDWTIADRILYHNDHEIWLFDLETGQKKIIARVSGVIDRAVWQNNGENALFFTDTSAAIIELDDREKRIITEILVLDRIEQPSLDRKKENIYFISGIGSQKGLFKLNLK